MAQSAFINAYQPLEPSRSLTLVSPRTESQRIVAHGRASSNFVAQLLAVRLDAPQYRAKRREYPVSAVASYAAVQNAIVAGQAGVAA